MSPAFRPSDDVGVVVAAEGDTVYLVRLPDGPLLVLEGPAATIWTEATTGGASGWVRRVAATFDETEERVAGDVRRLVSDLEERGIIERSEGDPQ